MCRFCGRKYVFPTEELIAAREASESAKDKEENRAAALKAMGIHIGLDPATGAAQVQLSQGKGRPAKALQPADVDAMLDAYNKLNKA